MLSVIGATSKVHIQTFTARVATIFSAVNMVALMFYQCSCIDGTRFARACNSSSWTKDNAEWVGFRKISEKESLVQIVSPHLWFLFLVTTCSIITWTRNYHRQKYGESRVPGCVFEYVKRSDADKSFQMLFKYLINFAFYKFGLEVIIII